MTRKMFFGIVLAVIASAIMLGVVLPMLMSAKSTMAVTLAITAMSVWFVAVVYYVYFKIIKKESK